MKTTFRWILALVFIGGGLFHFIIPDWYLEVMPEYLPFPKFLIGISGMLEVLGGTLLLMPDFRKTSRQILSFLLVVFLIVHVQHVWDQGRISEEFEISPYLAWARLLLQGVLLAWVRWVA